MNEIIKDVLKNGAIMFAVGALLALAAPPLANLLGGENILGLDVYRHAIGTPVLWTGAFFGAFGAIHAAVAPAAGLIFGDKGKEEAAPTPEKSQAPEINIIVQQAPPQQSVASAPEAAVSAWRDTIKTERAAAPAPGLSQP